MSQSGLSAFDNTIQTTNVWLNDISERMGWLDKHRAYHALRAVLHACTQALQLVQHRVRLDRGRANTRVFGAGILSSTGEIPFALCSADVKREPFVTDTVINTDYNPSRMQDHLFIASSLPFLRQELEQLVRRFGIPCFDGTASATPAGPGKSPGTPPKPAGRRGCRRHQTPCNNVTHNARRRSPVSVSP